MNEPIVRAEGMGEAIFWVILAVFWVIAQIVQRLNKAARRQGQPSAPRPVTSAQPADLEEFFRMLQGEQAQPKPPAQPEPPLSQPMRPIPYGTRPQPARAAQPKPPRKLHPTPPARQPPPIVAATYVQRTVTLTPPEPPPAPLPPPPPPEPVFQQPDLAEAIRNPVMAASGRPKLLTMRSFRSPGMAPTGRTGLRTGAALEAQWFRGRGLRQAVLSQVILGPPRGLE